MPSCTLIETIQHHSVGMGQVLVARKPGQLTAVLGSCVGLVLFHPRMHIGSLAHIVLPHTAGSDSAPGKFANLAIPHMLRLLEEQGASKSGLIAKLAGGACMFGHNGPLHIGKTNVEAVLRILGESGIRIAGKDVGGSKGRRVTFNATNGDLIVEIVGQPPCAL